MYDIIKNVLAQISTYKGLINLKIETDELIVRNFELKDQDDLCEYMMQRVDAEFERYEDFTKDKSKSEIEFRSKSDEFYAIELKKEHKVIGNVYFGKRNFESRELGYVLNENYQKKGYASAACKAFIDYAFKNGVRRIFAECCPQNTASWKLMEKIGLKREAQFKEDVSHRKDDNGNPIYWDTYVYALLNPNK